MNNVLGGQRKDKSNVIVEFSQPDRAYLRRFLFQFLTLVLNLAHLELKSSKIFRLQSNFNH